MNISSNHHYLPKFYLKGFTSHHNKKFAVFDKLKDSIKKDWYSPKSHFFEADRNTVVNDDGKSDFIEKVYQRLEDSTKEIIISLQKSKGPYDLNPIEIFNLQRFILCTYWRTPHLDDLLNKIITPLNLSSYGINIIEGKSGKSVSQDRLKELFERDGFTKGVRAMLIDLQFAKSNNNLDIGNWKISFEELSGKSSRICGDNPIIIRNSHSTDILSKDIIMPLTRARVLIRSANSSTLTKVPPEFILKIDQLVFLQSKRFVCCAHKEYMQAIIEYSKSKKHTTEDLKANIFDHLDFLIKAS